MEEDAVWAVFLPRHCARKEEFWTFGLEHSIRVQRVRSEDQCPAATGGHVTLSMLGSMHVKVCCCSHLSVCVYTKQCMYVHVFTYALYVCAICCIATEQPPHVYQCSRQKFEIGGCKFFQI